MQYACRETLLLLGVLTAMCGPTGVKQWQNTALTVEKCFGCLILQDMFIS